MIIHIVAGGPKEYIPDLSIYKEDKNIKWIAVDRGALYLQEFSITPDEAIGDFDSMTEEELEQLRNSGLKLD